ncbi:hypothetical protein Q7P37_008617 [Cladosporium fusiforme]
MPTTEFAVVPLVAGTSIGDPSHPGALIMKDSADTLHAQPGLQKVRFGTHVEDPDMLQMIVDWDGVENHEAFMASTDYGPFIARLQPVMGGAPAISHIDFQPSASILNNAFSAPVTEIATFYFDAEPNSDWLSNAAKAAEWLRKDAKGFLDVAYGITHEVVEYKGVKGKAAVIAVGWESKEAHMDFRETASFKENIGLLRGDSKAIEMHHVVFMEAVR